MTGITINIDTQPIARAAVDEAVRQAFEAPKYRGEACGPVFEEVKAPRSGGKHTQTPNVIVSGAAGVRCT